MSSIVRTHIPAQNMFRGRDKLVKSAVDWITGFMLLLTNPLSVSKCVIVTRVDNFWWSWRVECKADSHHFYVILINWVTPYMSIDICAYVRMLICDVCVFTRVYFSLTKFLNSSGGQLCVEMSWLNVKQTTRITNAPFTVSLGYPGNPSSSLHSQNRSVSVVDT